MKRLTLIRHAKSDWDNRLPDFERPLNARGEGDVPRMAARMLQYHERPDRLLSSPAVRALRTTTLLAQGLGIPEQEIRTEKDLYNASARALLDCLRATTDDHIGHLVLVAHNPGITDLANQLTNSRIDDLPTCAVLGAELEIEHWHEARPGCGRVRYYDYPKNPSAPEQRD
ncbi:MAG: histidine phosphatase family protein [Gammaproteobacteria bacterium]|nr:histidine phosphatase family protein [Gammaproteobacteria bacterium]